MTQNSKNFTSISLYLAFTFMCYQARLKILTIFVKNEQQNTNLKIHPISKTQQPPPAAYQTKNQPVKHCPQSLSSQFRVSPEVPEDVCKMQAPAPAVQSAHARMYRPITNRGTSSGRGGPAEPGTSRAHYYPEIRPGGQTGTRKTSCTITKTVLRIDKTYSVSKHSKKTTRSLSNRSKILGAKDLQMRKSTAINRRAFKKRRHYHRTTGRRTKFRKSDRFY